MTKSHPSLTAHPAERILLVPNGIDVDRFTPATVVERDALKAALGVGTGRPLIVFNEGGSHKVVDMLE